MASTKSIETGVDKLVALIQKKKKVSVDEAAKDLGVGQLVVQEWGEFLEEQGLITISYSLSKVMLIERKVAPQFVEQKARELQDEKENLVRKIETSVSKLDYDTAGLGTLKKEFDAIKKDLGGDMGKVKGEIEALSKYEDFKKTIDAKLKEQQLEFQKLISQSHMQIDAESKKYSEIVGELDAEKAKITLEKTSLERDRQTEEALQQKLKAMGVIIEQLRSGMDKEHTAIEDSEKHVDRLVKLLDTVRKGIDEKKEKDIGPLMRLEREHEAKIREMESEIVRKSQEAKAGIEQFTAKGQEASKKFVQFFEKRNQIEALIAGIDKDHEALREELLSLKKKTIAFSVASKTATPEEFALLEKKFKEIETKKGWISQELGKLTSLLK